MSRRLWCGPRVWLIDSLRQPGTTHTRFDKRGRDTSQEAVAADPKEYIDGRPVAGLRLDAEDAGRVFKHGQGPDRCDASGAREASVVLHDGIYHLFYDGAEPGVGWLVWRRAST